MSETTTLADGLQIVSPREPVGHVDATPDDDYVLRILGAHLDMQNCTVTADPPNVLADYMNYCTERRRVLLAHAMAVLVNHADAERVKLAPHLATVEEKWKATLTKVSGKTPEASAPPPT